jgi:hypothetical protein
VPEYIDERALIYLGSPQSSYKNLNIEFKSLQDSNVTLLHDRKSLPVQPDSMNIELRFDFANEQRGSAKFSHNGWQVDPFIKPNFYIFDTAFIHTHLFEGFTFARTPKENFTAFALGAEGVFLAKNVEELKRLKAQHTRDIGKLKKNVFEKIENLNAFIKLEIKESQSELESKQADLESLGKQQRKLLDNEATIKKRECLKSVSFYNPLPDALNAINQLFEQSKGNAHLEAKKKVENHINIHLKNQAETLSWLQLGLKLADSENCPFCSQSLSIDAMNLIEAYQQSFDKEFDTYVENVKKQLPHYQRIINDLSFSTLEANALANVAAIRNYPELLEKPELNEPLRGLEDNSKAISDELCCFKNSHKRLKTSLESLMRILINLNTDSGGT